MPTDSPGRKWSPPGSMDLLTGCRLWSREGSLEVSRRCEKSPVVPDTPTVPKPPVQKPCECDTGGVAPCRVPPTVREPTVVAPRGAPPPAEAATTRPGPYFLGVKTGTCGCGPRCLQEPSSVVRTVSPEVRVEPPPIYTPPVGPTRPPPHPSLDNGGESSPRLVTEKPLT